jgi:hypothetical protein
MLKSVRNLLVIRNRRGNANCSRDFTLCRYTAVAACTIMAKYPPMSIGRKGAIGGSDFAEMTG